jgi:hypothetical protein
MIDRATKAGPRKGRVRAHRPAPFGTGARPARGPQKLQEILRSSSSRSPERPSLVARNATQVIGV